MEKRGTTLFFHGTSVELNEGDVLRPPGAAGRQTFDRPHVAYSPSHVYVTTSKAQAAAFAWSAAKKHGGEERVYEVEPHTDIEAHPETAARWWLGRESPC